MVELTLENGNRKLRFVGKKTGHSALLLRCCCAALHCRYVIDMTSLMASISLMSICQATITTVGYGASQWHMCIPDVSVETERLKSKNFMSLFSLKWQRWCRRKSFLSLNFDIFWSGFFPGHCQQTMFKKFRSALDLTRFFRHSTAQDHIPVSIPGQATAAGFCSMMLLASFGHAKQILQFCEKKQTHCIWFNCIYIWCNTSVYIYR